jgi:hypothetical protein
MIGGIIEWRKLNEGDNSVWQTYAYIKRAKLPLLKSIRSSFEKVNFLEEL